MYNRNKMQQVLSLFKYIRNLFANELAKIRKNLSQVRYVLQPLNEC